MTTSFQYNIQNTSLFLFRMLIGTIGSFTPERLQNLNRKGKNEINCGRASLYLKVVPVEELSADHCPEEI